MFCKLFLCDYNAICVLKHYETVSVDNFIDYLPYRNGAPPHDMDCMWTRSGTNQFVQSHILTIFEILTHKITIVYIGFLKNSGSIRFLIATLFIKVLMFLCIVITHFFSQLMLDRDL